ncbi:hypothetical protein Tco_0855956 [Tanacetum coccineum]
MTTMITLMPFKKVSKRHILHGVSSLKKRTWHVRAELKSIENMDSNIRALRTTTKNLQEKDYQLTQSVISNYRVKKARQKNEMGKDEHDGSVPRELNCCFLT